MFFLPLFCQQLFEELTPMSVLLHAPIQQGGKKFTWGRYPSSCVLGMAKITSMKQGERKNIQENTLLLSLFFFFRNNVFRLLRGINFSLHTQLRLEGCGFIPLMTQVH